MKLDTMEVGPRTILMSDGAPVLVTLMMRESGSTPARIKATLVASVEDEDDGSVGILPLPFAEPIIAPPGRRPRGYTPEWRLEMN